MVLCIILLVDYHIMRTPVFVASTKISDPIKRFVSKCDSIGRILIPTFRSCFYDGEKKLLAGNLRFHVRKANNLKRRVRGAINSSSDMGHGNVTCLSRIESTWREFTKQKPSGFVFKSKVRYRRIPGFLPSIFPSQMPAGRRRCLPLQNIVLQSAFTAHDFN